MRTRFHFVVYLVVACVLVSTASESRAQSFQGGMRGSVKDAQGVIPGATVSLIN